MNNVHPQTIEDLLADTDREIDARVDDVQTWIEEATVRGNNEILRGGRFVDVVEMLWRAKGHKGCNAWDAMEKIVAKWTGPETGSAADELIATWEQTWLDPRL